MAVDDEEFEGDLSPISIFLIGCIVTAFVVSIFKKILQSAEESRTRFRRRTREEENGLLAALPPPVFVAREEPEPRAVIVVERVPSIEPDDENEDDHISEVTDEIGEDGGAEADGPHDVLLPRMSRKEIHKAEKKKKKQEQQDAWLHHLENQRRLEQLREAEAKEREDFEKKREEERRRNSKAKPIEVRITERDVASFIDSYQDDILPLGAIQVQFPSLTHTGLTEFVRKVQQKSMCRNNLIMLSDNRILKVSESVLNELRKRIRLSGMENFDMLLSLVNGR